MLNEFLFSFFNHTFSLVGDNYLLSIIIFIFFSCFILVFPIPSSIILIFSGVFFDSHSFIINYTVLNIASVLTFYFCNRIFSSKNVFFKKIKLKVVPLSEKINNDRKINHLILFRAFLPFSIYNISSGIISLSLKKFIISNFIGLIPRTLMISSLGTGLKQAVLSNYNIYSMVFENIYLRLFVLLFLTFQLLKAYTKDF